MFSRRMNATLLATGAAVSSSLLLVFLRMRLWEYDFHVPFVYWGDALFPSNVLAKALTEGAWIYHIARLGAPFGMDVVDFPAGCTLDFAVLKLLTAISQNPVLSTNLYWLLTIVLSGAFAALFFRSLQIGYLVSASFATLFAISPFVFYRNISHLVVLQSIVPAAAYLAIDLARGGVFGISENNPPSEGRSTSRRILLGRLAICAAIGLTFTYWGFSHASSSLLVALSVRAALEPGKLYSLHYSM
jgi:hypothetical protein